jgi:hypothetical protein
MGRYPTALEYFSSLLIPYSPGQPISVSRL